MRLCVMEWILAAEQEAQAKGIGGYALTPFLLGDLAIRSKGQTLRANLALLENNAAVAARLSCRLKEQVA